MENITLTIEETDRLLALGDGDAALVFLSGKRGREPSLGEARLREARRKLAGAGILPSSFAERPSYSQGEIARGMLTNPGFHTVVNETERVLGRALSPSDMQTLYSVCHWRGLPPEVILPLLYHCAGEQGGKPLTVRRIDREAAVWEREGVMDETSAELYIRKKEASREASSRVFSSLGIFGREPSATEKNYVAAWLALGLTVEAIALAYDKTVVNTGRLAWGYCDKILRRWHENGWHTPEEIERYDKRPASPAPKNAREAAGSVDRARQALRRVKGEPGNGG
ncbi:MAG: DnaD domain protein [Oscillospiraceae bacterium]|jgi:DnaD/phage-associated family protein|nr:DnaD domain protein [Oscillospiraceae bacterium]